MVLSDRELLRQVKEIHGSRDVVPWVGVKSKSTVNNWVNGKSKPNLTGKQRRILNGKLRTIKNAEKTLKHFKPSARPAKITKNNVKSMSSQWFKATHTTVTRRIRGKKITKSYKLDTLSRNNKISDISFSDDRRYVYGVMEFYGSKGQRFITSRKYNLSEMTLEEAELNIHNDIADALYRNAYRYEEGDKPEEWFDNAVSYELYYTLDVRNKSLIHQDQEAEFKLMTEQARQDRRDYENFKKLDLYDEHEYDSMITPDENFLEYRKRQYEYED